MDVSTCLLSPSSHQSLGNNVNGPCVIEVPKWIPSPLGRYYMYFAHHQGLFIRMAYADCLTGPWSVHVPGVLTLKETPCAHNDLSPHLGHEYNYAHIASPNIQLDVKSQSLVMYYHGLEEDGSQATRVCFSSDGLTFTNHSTTLTAPYFAGFTFKNAIYGITFGGQLCCATRWDGPFEETPSDFAKALYGPNAEAPRHFGVAVNEDQLSIYFTRIGDAPERILKSTCTLKDNWHEWRASPAIELLVPSHSWEGVDNKIEKSKIGAAAPMEHALRDPFPFKDHLFYAAGGESAIGVTKLIVT